MKKIRTEKQKEQFRALLAEAMKHCSSAMQAFQLANAQWQKLYGNK
jgi:hypothetical protein